MTAADGTGLKLISVDAQAVVDGPLAFTELKLVFENPADRFIEGRFNIVMPDGAAISRFAMKIQGKWMEGEVVEKQAARRAYEDALHQRRDPALLEQDAGNAFRARVFPINPRERKELIISWSNNLTKTGESYRLPLKGLPKIQRLELRAVTAATNTGAAQSSLGGDNAHYQVTSVSKTDFTPDQDWVITGAPMADSGEALRQGNLMATRFLVPVQSEQDAIPHAVVMVDTSASRAIDYESRLQRLKDLINGLGGIGVERVQVIAYDQSSQEIFDGAPAQFGSTEVAALKARAALEVQVRALLWTHWKRRRANVE